MNSTMFGRCFIIMPCLNAIDRLAELALADSVGIGCGFAVRFINRHLLVIDTGGIGGCRNTLHFGGILVGVIRDCKIEEFSSSILVVRIHLDGAGVIEAGRIGSIDISCHLLAAIAPGTSFSERPAFSVSGDAEPVVNWLIDEQSLDGKFKVSEMIARWQDKGWITRTNNDHPLAYMAAAMCKLCTLINHHIGNAPKVELVKRGNKTLGMPVETPEARLGILINKFTRG